MPSAFDDRFCAQGVPKLVRHHGETITYNDRDGSNELKITDATLTREESERRQNEYGIADQLVTRRATFPEKDREKIRMDGQVTIGMKKYSIESVMSIAGHRMRLNLVRHEVIEVATPEYRRLP